jgi:hypothetical protein
MGRLIKPPRKAKACAHCLHFAPTGTVFVVRPTGETFHAIGEQVRGDCRARPPKPNRKTGEAVWPDVVGNDWCSGFARPETKADRGAA